MKTNNPIIRYASKNDYLRRKPIVESTDLAKNAAGGLKEGATSEATAASRKKGLKETIEDGKNKVKDKASEVKEAGSHLLGQAVGAAARMIPGSLVPSLPSIDGDVSLNEAKAAKKTEEPAFKPPVHRPGIFFIKGLHLNPFSSGEGGLDAMSENIPSSEVLKWNQEDELVDLIKGRALDQPIIVIGHGMGSDTAVSAVNRLNSPEGGFRKIDLLITLDSIGTDNDIIPQNVKRNMNYITDQDTLFNDGPNVARDLSKTEVVNELRLEGHNELESSPEVQFDIFEQVNEVLLDAIKEKKVKQAQDKISLDQARALVQSFRTPSLPKSMSLS